MRISTKDWRAYVDKLRRLSDTAAEMMQEYVRKNGFADKQALINYAYGLVTKYGEGSAELACQMYDAIAELEGVIVAPAVPAPTATLDETGAAIGGSLLQSETGQLLEAVVDKLVKLPAEDTMLQNAIRDGAFFAWIPSGDTCPFCITLASAGWRAASKAVMKGNHAEHIHAHCDCQFMVRHSNDLNVSGYNPAKYYRMYQDADGNSSKDKINALRRIDYAKNKTKINEQKRNAYAIRNGNQEI